jgi:hypothetical protein
MTHTELIECFKRYEQTHAIEHYRCYDWNVWPLLRIATSYEALAQQRIGFGKRLRSLLHMSRPAWRLRRWINRHRESALGETFANIDVANRQSPPAAGHAVVVLTLSDRRQRLGDALYEIYADPLAEAFERRNVFPLIWERGVERWPRNRPSAWVSRALARKMLSLSYPAPLPKPAWFDDFGPFASVLLGRRVSWSETEARIQQVQQQSEVFGCWLKACGAKLLIAVCWYDAEVMAATLAAKRLGIVTTDLQHGLQGSAHLAYAGWATPPQEAYETVPDIFQVWGRDAAHRTLEDNPAFRAQSKTLVTGNLWLEKWIVGSVAMEGDDAAELKSLTGKSRKVLLFTLQHGFGCQDFLLEAMRQAPADWFWLLRFHPATQKQERIKIYEKLRTVSGTRYEATLTSKVSFYTLLQLAHIHMTGHSTSALEALGFGLPTITVSPTGAEAFKPYLDKGVMKKASNAQELLREIRLCENIPAKLCRQAAEDIFSSPSVAAEGVDRLLSIAGIEKGV